MAIASTISGTLQPPGANPLDQARQYMIQHRWADAARVLASIPNREINAEFQINLCRNLAAIHQHRPIIYAALMAPAAPSRYSIGVTSSGHITVLYLCDDGQQKSLSPGDHPVAALSSVFASIKEPYQNGKPIALFGFGDGYLIKSCSLNAPKLIFGMEQNIYIFEPDPQAIMSCLMIHDYTGPNGAIEQQRFHWFVGEHYIADARKALVDDLFNQVPVAEISLSPHQSTIADALKLILDETYQQFLQHKAKVKEYCEKLTASHFADILSYTPSRPPRAMLITTRNSSVLQYSTADAADGLRELGWEVRVMIEPTPRNVLTGQKVMQTLCDFQPDMVFQIDHLRSEWVDIFPDNLPFVCWIQDHLTNLTTVDAGRKVGRRDFLLCGMPLMYRDRYEYPIRQFLQMPKLTRVPSRPAKWTPGDIDLIYVSSASQNPEQRVEQLVAEESKNSQIQRLVANCCQKMIQFYTDGQSLPSIGSVGELLDITAREMDLSIENKSGRAYLSEKLFDRLNNTLYRQQAIGWAKQISEKHNLKFALYGPGWDKHAEFSPFARGPIAYGAALEKASREAKINLILEPTLNISHQRLLDALVAGGFCLVRDHPSNSVFQQLANFLFEQHLTELESVEEAKKRIPDSANLAVFNSLLDQLQQFATMGDAVAQVNMMIKSQVFLNRPDALPELKNVSFADAGQLEQLILNYLHAPEKRQAVSDQQRTDVESRFSYTSGMKRMINWMHNLITTETI